MSDGSASDYQVELGTGRLLDGLEQAHRRHAGGRDARVDDVLPDEAPKKVAGKDAIFTSR